MPGAWPSLPSDLRGSVHVFETLLVGFMVAGAVVAVATMHDADDNPHENLLPQDPRQTQDVLDVYMELPTQSTHIHYTNRLEEMSVEHLKAGADPNSIDTELVRELRRHQSGANHRLELSVDGHRLQITGDPAPPENNPSSATVMWNSQLGTTLIEPTMSHHDPTMMVHNQILPVWADRIPHPTGHPYEVSLELEADDVAPLQHETVSHYREPYEDQTILLVEPVDAKGEPQSVVSPRPIDLDLGTTEWDVHFQIAPHQHDGSSWLDQETGLRLHRPPGWDPPAYNDTNWQRQNPEDEPVWDLRYIGTPQAADQVHWFNLSLSRSTLEPPAVMHPLTLQVDGESWSQATVLLKPEEMLQGGPLVVYPNIPHPIPVDAPADLRFLVTNPSDQERTLSRFQVRFEDASHRFHHEPAGWQRERVDDSVVYTRLKGGDHVLEPRGTTVVALPMKLEKPDGSTVLQAHPPIIEYLGPGEQMPSTIDGYHGDDAMTSVPHGDRGHYFSWLEPPSLQPGAHTVRVPYNEDLRIPPGVGTYEMTLDLHPFLRELQETRNTMSLEVRPEQIQPGDDITLRLDTAELLPLLRQSPGVQDDRVRLTITTSDLIGRLTGTHESQIEYDLDLDWNAQITGLAWMPTDSGQETYDLVVGYSDGRMARLDGENLPNQTHWRQTIADTITAGPYWLEGEDGSDGQIAVFVQDGRVPTHQLRLLSPDGTVDAGVPLDGYVHEAIVTDCQEGPDGLAFLTSGTTSARLRTGAHTVTGDTPEVTWSRLEHYQDGTHQESKSWTATQPAGLALGKIGPWAQCSLLAGVNSSPVDARELGGQVHRYSLEPWEKQWHTTVPGGIASLHTAPIGTPHYDGYFNEEPIDRLIVVNATGSWRVHGAYTHDAAANGQISWQAVEDGEHIELQVGGLGTMPGLPPGDTLIGMSWVNHTTGYVASAGGIVWETTSAGNEWVLMEE